ncbi:hypothetical protein FNF31_04962 [Cafeteria roenbergensis]|uniref:asparaginase n=1 Tax=Cafeteria roenbergensis TaxID=33653 RepID=A0A5A8D1H3_CAFRO|nr:hypothetical protein FNF31_04962 [Cafeteria roenbergensis]
MAAAAAASAAAVAAASAAGDSASSAADAHPSVVISASRTSAGTAWSDPVVVKHRKSPKERSIFVIYMGGTLGMKPNEEGALEPAPGYLLSRMREMREFAEDEMPAVTLVEHEPLLDSSDMGPPEWIGIVEVLHRHYYDYDGFVVIMGTDTMAYAASAASFMMENLGKPVVFTGSMVPLCELYNDAKRNLVVACILAGYVDVPEVTLFINSTLFRGNRVTKVDSHGLDAFDSPNYAPLVRLATGFRVNFAAFRPQPKGRFRISTELCDEIAVLRMVPGFSDNYINAIIEHTPTIRGIVLQLYGTGNAAQRNGSFMAAVQAAIRRGIMVVATTQCAKGGVKLETYALGRRLLQAGVISAGDMTTEGCTCKLAWLLARPGASLEKTRRAFRKNLRGELTESDAFVTSHGATVSSIIEDHSVAHGGASGALSVAEMRSAAGRPSRLGVHRRTGTAGSLLGGVASMDMILKGAFFLIAPLIILVVGLGIAVGLASRALGLHTNRGWRAGPRFDGSVGAVCSAIGSVGAVISTIFIYVVIVPGWEMQITGLAPFLFVALGAYAFSPRRHRGSAMEARKRGVKAATQPERARDDDEQLGSSGSDSGDDSVSSDEDVPKGSHARPGRAPKDEPEPDSDDWLLFLAAFLGFCIAMASAVALLRADTELDRSYVMGAAMVIIAVSAMGSSLCAKGKNTAGLEDDSVSPLLVFVVAGGFGLLLGGLFGDLSRRFPAGTILIPGVF